MHVSVILHNIRSAHNVGSIFRTADGAGVSALYLCGYTPAPVDRFGRTNPEIKKTSLGATESVRWEVADDTVRVVRDLQSHGVTVIAVEQHPRAIPYTTQECGEHCAFIFGNEIDGVPPELCEIADAVVHIPMHGMKESLNVAVAAGIILFNTQ